MTKPLINLVHANGFPAGSYKTFLGEFNEKFSTIAHDQYGHNHKYPIHTNWQHLVTELLDYLKQQDEKVICIGHSFGGILSFLAACQHPELFRGVIMLDPPVVTGPFSHVLKVVKKTRLIDKWSPAGRAQNRQRHWPLNTNLVGYFAQKNLFKNFDPRCLKDYIDHGVTQRNKRLELSFTPEVEADIFRHLPCNLARYKNQLKVPAALIYGEKTDVFPVKYFTRFANLNNIEVSMMPNGGHMFPLEQPQNTANMIKAIVKDW
ncbi:alpha/beta fold hydrolase [Shewanella sp. 10N.286.48.B5]|uniref:alpha/beta fold hydrolase n=1 Tax=Shewanella sp. 10N.286.48.B5 TaxID=1880834 RepID=UPI000C821419|nr:alpha/beta hydrolase [Shewanella sp. 10N.286.48.B5]PMH86057.1 alpha/beta hydrolase [Shewanella sp. 10N.286.48.B5]